MPIFEYRCRKCGHVSEFLENPDGNGKHVCPKCGSTGMEKLFSRFSARTSSPEWDSPSCSRCPTDACPYRDDST
ncbi:MAG: hypothetical protein AMJ81_06635 [Phycisphaerae bacterium SM23_33]|nr:MAG: hypothetical protein AMJ81_06635 [Phycisphaerae bacterium SM23_33]